MIILYSWFDYYIILLVWFNIIVIRWLQEKKTSREQFASYLQFLGSNQILRFGKGDPEVKKKEFNRLVSVLNGAGGVIKSEEGWKKVYILLFIIK